MKISNGLFLLIMIATITACKKNQIEISPVASIIVVNTITGGQTIKMNNYSSTVSNNAYGRFAFHTGAPNIYVFPLSDSLSPYYKLNQDIQLESGDVYTLFLGGQFTQAEGILVKEDLQYHNDSTVGIRFMNLSPNSPNVNVTLSTSNSKNEFSNISYKAMSDFKIFPALANNISYTFQVRNSIDNSLIASITLTGSSLTTGIPRFKNITLVLRGIVGGVPAAGLTRVDHF
jgi:hypothetical protein